MDNHFASNALLVAHHKYQFVASTPRPESFHAISSIILLGCSVLAPYPTRVGARSWAGIPSGHF